MAIGVNTTISSADLTGQSASGTLTVSVPSGTNATDILILVVANFAAAPTLAAPSGWTAIGSKVQSTNVAQWSYWALGNVSNLGFTRTNFGPDQAWVMIGFTGVDNSTPIDVTGASVTNSGSNSITAGSITIATDQAWELISTADVNDGAFSATGFTAKDNGSTLHQRCGLMYNTTPKSTGSTGTVSCSNSASATGEELLVLPFALRPAAAGASTAPITPFDQMGGIIQLWETCNLL